MKKFALILALLLTLTACGGAADETETTPDTDAAVETEDTADTEEETAEEETEDAGSDAVVPEGGATSVDTVDDVVTFIDVNVYGQTPDYLPMMVMTMPLDLGDMDTITYQTGLTDLTGITDIVWSESGVGSFAYSFLYVRTDGTDTAGIQEKLGSSVDPRKWVCVTAEKICTVQLDNDVVLVMGSPEQVDAIMGAVTTAAEGLFETIGDVVSVMG